MTALTLLAASALIEPRIITKHQFDKITDIHKQQEFTEEEITAIGKIFLAHGVVYKYSLQLLHRHFTLPEKTLVLTQPIELGIAVSKVTPVEDVDLANVRGQLYYLNDDRKFQAYEYEYGPPVDFPEMFLADLAAFVEQHNMGDRFALASTAAKPGSKPFKEWEIGSQATVMVEGNRALETDGTSIKVNYRYEVPERYPPTAKIGGGHEETNRGTHSVLYTSGTCASLRSDQPFDFGNCDIVEVLRDNGYIE
jgi:hypothetical protein